MHTYDDNNIMNASLTIQKVVFSDKIWEFTGAMGLALALREDLKKCSWVWDVDRGEI